MHGGQTGRIACGGRAGGDRHRVAARPAARVAAGAGTGAALRRSLRPQSAQGGEAGDARALRRRRRDRARRCAGAYVLHHPRGPGHRRAPRRAAGHAAPGRVLRRDGPARPAAALSHGDGRDRRSEEHTLNSSHMSISYAVFCLKKKKQEELKYYLIKKKKDNEYGIIVVSIFIMKWYKL